MKKTKNPSVQYEIKVPLSWRESADAQTEAGVGVGKPHYRNQPEKLQRDPGFARASICQTRYAAIERGTVNWRDREVNLTRFYDANDIRCILMTSRVHGHRNGFFLLVGSVGHLWLGFAGPQLRSILALNQRS